MLHLQPQCLVSCCCRISPSFSSFTQIWSLQHLCTEVCHSFYIGFDWRSPLSPPPSNFGQSQITLLQYTSTLLRRWKLVDCCHQVATGWLLLSEGPTACKNSIRITPKPQQPGKFGLIVDLSAPPGLSVNNGKAHNLCSAAQMVTRCRCSALMAKTDLQSAYRHGTVNGKDQHLLGIEWDRTTYIDRALPLTSDADFRCRGWASIGLEMWSVHNCVHCLDDFLL